MRRDADSVDWAAQAGKKKNNGDGNGRVRGGGDRRRRSGRSDSAMPVGTSNTVRWETRKVGSATVPLNASPARRRGLSLGLGQTNNLINLQPARSSTSTELHDNKIFGTEWLPRSFHFSTWWQACFQSIPCRSCCPYRMSFS